MTTILLVCLPRRGGLMPERFVQDASQQCTPVTRTRFVKKQVGISVIDMSSPVQYNQFTATTGVIMTPIPGTGQRPGQMMVQVPDDMEATVNLDLPGGALATGKQISVTTQVTMDGDQPMEVQLVQVPANPVDENDLVILDRRTVRFAADVKFDVAATNADNLQMLFKTTAGVNMGYKVGTTQYQVVDDVQENYVVVVCNDNGEFGKDYRFGFNGQMKDNELKGMGNSLDFKCRAYDARLGKFLSVDPLVINYPYYSPYHFAGNRPIDCIDLEGGEPLSFMSRLHKDDKGAVGTAARTYLGIYDGTLISVNKTWNFVSRDAWKAQTWKNAGNGVITLFDLSFGNFEGQNDQTAYNVIQPKIDNFQKEVINGDAYTRSRYFAEFGTDLLTAYIGSKGLASITTFSKGVIINQALKLTNIVTERGIGLVAQHLEQFGVAAENTVMLERLEKIQRGAIQATQTDINFYVHELRERALMEQGMGYEEAHAQTLKEQGLNHPGYDTKLYTKEALDAGNAQWEREATGKQ